MYILLINGVLEYWNTFTGGVGVAFHNRNLDVFEKNYPDPDNLNRENSVSSITQK